MKKEKGKKSGKFVGCLKRMIVPVCLIGFCVVFALLTLFPILPKLGQLTPYKTLLQELSVEVKASDMSQNPLQPQDRWNMEDLVNDFVECKELEKGQPKSLFDIGGNFIYDHIKKDNINIKAEKLELDKRALGAFVNSAIGAGWIEGFFDQENSKELVSVLEIPELKTQDDRTRMTVIMKADASFFDADVTQKSKTPYSDSYLYVVYTAEFVGQTVQTATMHFNKISDESNQLLLETLFEAKGEEIQPHINSILEAVLKQLDKIRTEWDLNYYFAGEKLVISSV